MQRNYCYICGSKLKAEKEGIWWCDSCEQQYFANPIPCVEAALFDDKGQVLLAERGNKPNKGKYDLPGGFIDTGETAEEALYRELEEELGLQSHQVSQPQYVGCYTSQYPYGKVTYQTLIFVYAASIEADVRLQPQDDVASARFVSLDALGEVDIAVPTKLPALISKALTLVRPDK